jgi:hypothetical protein
MQKQSTVSSGRMPLTLSVVGPFGCWEPNRKSGTSGYVPIKVGGKADLLHRAVYTALIGPIPHKHHLHHSVCENRRCCNPWHVTPLAPSEHSALEPTAVRNRAVTHCPSGHEYAGSNLYIDPRGDRQCRTCRRERKRTGQPVQPTRPPG